jgi:hypothetical protein
MNAGAGGNYIFLCYQTAETHYVNPITEVKVTVSPHSGNYCGAEWTQIGVDLNQGAGGYFIHICYR